LQTFTDPIDFSEWRSVALSFCGSFILFCTISLTCGRYCSNLTISQPNLLFIRNSIKMLEKILGFGLIMILVVVPTIGNRTALYAGEPVILPQPESSITCQKQESSPPLPVYHIPLRVHLNESARPAAAFTEILEEINHIWWSQAGICFEMQVVMNDDVKSPGFDIWFVPRIDNSNSINGVYSSGHSIYVRDTPILRAAHRSAQHPTARTAAHELGHALGLPHRQDSDDNLMRSKTFGWQLNREEIAIARKAAASRAIMNNIEPFCGPIQIKP
jgi:hypothetical protein